MKIVIFCDKYGTAIDRLAQMVVKNNPHHDIRVHAVHPKRNDAETLHEAVNLMMWADIIDVHYWKSGEVLKTSFRKQWDEKPKVLFHFNPYDVDKQNWLDTYDYVVVGNQSIHNNAPYAYLIPYAVDLSFFRFNNDYVDKENKNINMVVGRIEGKKGVYEVALACKELGYRLKLVGRVSNGEYMQKVLNTGVVDFLENATDELMYEVYKDSAVHVCNSVDGFESGTLPILEAMASGVPVLTRVVGHVPDINNGKNLVTRKGSTEDVEDLKKTLKEMVENYEWRKNLRDEAFNTVRNYDSRRMTMRITNIYDRMFEPDYKRVSIIIPTRDNAKAFSECLVSAVKQNYPKKEIIVVDSGEQSVLPLVQAVQRSELSVPIKYIHFPHRNTYTLAEARNRGVIESEGEILVFCDDRLKMNDDAVKSFAMYAKEKTWLWGIKDNCVKGFVENFSAIMRKDLIASGMFNERIQWYGGMSQEIRTRFESEQGFDFVFIQEAKAVSTKKAKSKNSRRMDIIEAKHLLYKMYRD